MRRIIIVCLTCLVYAASAEEEISFSEKAIRQGNWGLGLHGNIAYDSIRGLNYYLSSELQYFFRDGFAAGIQTSYEKNRFIERESYGLLATYYFYEMENSAFFVSQSVTWNHIQSDFLSKDINFWSGTTKLGYDYFLNKHVAIGPRLQYEINPMTTWGQVNLLSLGFGLSVFF